MRPPILVNESTIREEIGDCDIFETIYDAELYFEPWYADESYFAFDIDGRELEIVPDEIDRPVRFVELEGVSPDPEIVRKYVLFIIELCWSQFEESVQQKLAKSENIPTEDLAALYISMSKRLSGLGRLSIGCGNGFPNCSEKTREQSH